MEKIYKVTHLGGKSHDPRVAEAPKRPHSENWNVPFREHGKLTRRGRLARGIAMFLLPSAVTVGIMAAESGSGSGHEKPAAATARAHTSGTPESSDIGGFIDLSAPHKQINAKPGDNISKIAATELPDMNNTAATNMITDAIMKQYGIKDKDQAQIVQPGEGIPLPEYAQPGEGVIEVPGVPANPNSATAQ
ncbi:MAG TPA: hypothetical protein VHD60_03670 [Candidatus Saccharimonadales bacterium]|nr:hypothetical protein [Candidatus Saccharimonadales bacterium]